MDVIAIDFGMIGIFKAEIQSESWENTDDCDSD